MVALDVHGSTTIRVETPRRDNIDTHAAFEFDDELIRTHGEAQGDRRCGVEKFPRTLRRLRQQLGAVGVTATAGCKISLKRVDVGSLGQPPLGTHRTFRKAKGFYEGSARSVVSIERCRKLDISCVTRVFRHELECGERQETPQIPARSGGSPVETAACRAGREGGGQECGRPVALRTPQAATTRPHASSGAAPLFIVRVNARGVRKSGTHSIIKSTKGCHRCRERDGTEKVHDAAIVNT